MTILQISRLRHRKVKTFRNYQSWHINPGNVSIGFNPWVGKIPWRRERLPTPVFWPGEFHGLYVHGSHTLSNFHFHFQFVSTPL